MDDDDRPQRRSGARGDDAGLLSSESLDSYSLDELDARIERLEAEILRVKAHREKSASHRQDAEALFRTKSS